MSDTTPELRWVPVLELSHHQSDIGALVAVAPVSAGDPVFPAQKQEPSDLLGQDIGG